MARTTTEVAPFVLLACACGAAVSAPLPSPAASVAPAPGPPPLAPAAPESFDDLAGLAPTLAPGMSEIARKASSGDAVELLGAAANDACVRVVFAAESPVVTKLVDGSGETLATAGPAVQGALGERGPVCVRRGEIIRGVAEGAGRSHVRWMAWQAP